MWCFCNLLHSVSGSPDSDPPETLEKKVGSKVSKANHTLTEFASKNLQADCFGMVWLYNFLAVSGRQDERRIRTLRNYSEMPDKSFQITRSYEYPSIFWQVCRDLLTAGAIRNWCVCAIWCSIFSIWESFESHWITITTRQIIAVYYQNYSGWKFHQQWFQHKSNVEVGCSNCVFLDTNKHDVRTVEERTWCQQTFYLAARNVALVAQ